VKQKYIKVTPHQFAAVAITVILVVFCDF